MIYRTYVIHNVGTFIANMLVKDFVSAQLSSSTVQYITSGASFYQEMFETYLWCEEVWESIVRNCSQMFLNEANLVTTHVPYFEYLHYSMVSNWHNALEVPPLLNILSL